MSLRTQSRSRPSTTRLGLAAAITTVTIAAAPSFAMIVAWNGAIVKVVPPASVELDKTQSDVQITAFDEQQCFQLPTPIEADHGSIPANTWVSCHFFHADPEHPPIVLDGKAQFDADIIDVISSTAGLDASDDECGLGTVAYPTGTEPFRGLEAFQVMDRYQLLNSRTIQIQVDVPSYSDQVRVITECCPDGQQCD